MKLTRYAADKNNPAVKGNLTAEEIVRTDWERNYKNKGISLGQAKAAIKAHIDSGGNVARVRNTLILVTPDDESFHEIKFHTITADPAEVYQTMMLMFLVSLNNVKGTQIVYTYVDDKSPARMARRLFPKDYVDLEESDDPDEGKYRLTIDLGRAVTALKQKLPARGA